MAISTHYTSSHFINILSGITSTCIDEYPWECYRISSIHHNSFHIAITWSLYRFDSVGSGTVRMPSRSGDSVIGCHLKRVDVIVGNVSILNDIWNINTTTKKYIMATISSRVTFSAMRGDSGFGIISKTFYNTNEVIISHTPSAYWNMKLNS